MAVAIDEMTDVRDEPMNGVLFDDPMNKAWLETICEMAIE
jgi:hypothetical protein